MTDRDSFLAGLERAAEFLDEQAHIMRLAVAAKVPSEFWADTQKCAERVHTQSAKMIRGMKANYASGKLELPALTS